MSLTGNRIDASLLTEQERASLQMLLNFAHREKHASLKGADGLEMPLPQPIFDLLVKVIEDIRHGRAVVLLPEAETFTTQAAANFLGMSRQHFVTLLESGQIPFHRVGSHRRVTFKELSEYATKRDAERHARVRSLFKKVKEAGQYDADYTGDNAG